MVSAVMQLLLLIVAATHPEQNLISQLNNHYKFDHNIFLLHSTVDRERFFDSPHSTTKPPEITPQSVFVFKNVRNRITGLETLTAITSKNTFLIVSPGHFKADAILLRHIKRIQLLDINMKIGILFSGIVSTYKMKKLLDWCWKHRIVQIFIAFESTGNPSQLPNSNNFLNIFRLNIFQTFDVINVTGSESIDRVFPSEFLNYNRYPLRIAEPQRPSDTDFWHAILQVLNASSAFVSPDKFFSYSMTEWCDYDDGVDVVGQLQGYVPEVNFLYPIYTLTAVIVVPEAIPYSSFTNYLTAIASDQLFISIFITILVTVSFLTGIRYIKERKIKIFQSTVDVLNVLLINDNANITYQRLCLAEVFILSALTFGGFAIVNVITSMFQSHLTRPYKQFEIDTIEDLYRSPFPVVTSDGYTDSLNELLNNLYEHEGWTEKMQSMEVPEFIEQINTFNASMSFPFDQARAERLIKLQKQLNIRGYRIPSESHLEDIWTSYVSCDDYPFIDRLNDIIHRIQSAGLFERWFEKELQEWLQHIRVRNRNITRETMGDIVFDQFQFVEFIMYGYVAAGLVFVLEILWSKVKMIKVVRRVEQSAI